MNRPEAKNETSFKLKSIFKMEVKENKKGKGYFVRKGKKIKFDNNKNDESAKEAPPVVNASTLDKAFSVISHEEIISAFPIVEKYYE